MTSFICSGLEICYFHRRSLSHCILSAVRTAYAKSSCLKSCWFELCVEDVPLWLLMQWLEGFQFTPQTDLSEFHWAKKGKWCCLNKPPASGCERRWELWESVSWDPCYLVVLPLGNALALLILWSRPVDLWRRQSVVGCRKVFSFTSSLLCCGVVCDAPCRKYHFSCL